MVVVDWTMMMMNKWVVHDNKNVKSYAYATFHGTMDMISRMERSMTSRQNNISFGSNTPSNILSISSNIAPQYPLHAQEPQSNPMTSIRSLISSFLLQYTCCCCVCCWI